MATFLVAASPSLYFFAVGEDVKEGERVTLALVTLGLAWLPLVISIGLARRARRRPADGIVWPSIRRSLVPLAAVLGIFALLRHLSFSGTLSRGGAWVLALVCGLSVWTALSSLCLRRPPRRM